MNLGSPARLFLRVTAGDASPLLLWRLYMLAVLAMLPALFIQYIGEEGVYVILAQEMRASGDYVHGTLYGRPYGRPGLFPWLILALSEFIGENNGLIAARCIAVAATALTGLVLAWLVRRVLRDPVLAALAAVVYLSGDMLFQRGWLAYADPLFGLCVFGAMACLWVALSEGRSAWLLASGAALVLAFLAKGLPAYIYYSGMGAALLLFHGNRRFLVHPVSLFAHGMALAVPFLWDARWGGGAVFGTFLANVRMMLAGTDGHVAFGTWAHLVHVLGYPLQLVWHLLPASALALGALVKRKAGFVLAGDGSLRIAGTALLVNVLPYWLAADGGMRYMVPLYPLFALVGAMIIKRAGGAFPVMLVRTQCVLVVAACVVTAVAYPAYERIVRGDYATVAQTIFARTQGRPLYARDDSSVGLSLVAHLNDLRTHAGQPPLTVPPEGWTEGFVLAVNVTDIPDATAIALRIGNRQRYLMCRGPVCGAAGAGL